MRAELVEISFCVCLVLISIGLYQRERKNRKVGSVDMSELSISVQPIRRHNCEEWKCATNKNALRSQNCSWARPVRILLTYLQPTIYVRLNFRPFIKPSRLGLWFGVSKFLLAFILSKMTQNIVETKVWKLKKIVALGFE